MGAADRSRRRALLAAAGALALVVRRERVLLSEGRLALARVISSTKVGGSHGHSYRVRYEFRTLSGATVTATASRSRPLAADATTVAVVYHRENARWNAVYPLSLAACARRDSSPAAEPDRPRLTPSRV